MITPCESKKAIDWVYERLIKNDVHIAGDRGKVSAEIILDEQDIKRLELPADSDLLFMHPKDASKAIDDPDLALGAKDIIFEIQHLSE